MITIVVGAQYGGEGKGKVCSYLGYAASYRYVCRTGGVNSCHAVRRGNAFYKLRMMPASAVVAPATYLFGAGSLIHIPTLMEEMERLDVPKSSVIIDPQAGVVTEECVQRQRADDRYRQIGSTLTGTGYATAERGLRRLPLARDFPELSAYMGDVAGILFEAQRNADEVLVEGHQGTGLSVYHGDYPYSSSRDCIAAALLSELGVSPRVELEIVLAMKMFPTRNHGGRLPNEIDHSSAVAHNIFEHGGGSWGIPDRERRVGQLDWSDVERAVMLNGPTAIAITGFDYAFPSTRGARTVDNLPADAHDFIAEVEKRTGVQVGLVSTGPDVLETIALADRFHARARTSYTTMDR